MHSSELYSVKRLIAEPRAVITGLSVTALLLVAIQRLLVIDVEVDWDEEMYFQISHLWLLGKVPYKDIFDHKPPMIYLFYMITSWSAHLTIARIVVGAVLLGGIVSLFKVLASLAVIPIHAAYLGMAILTCLMSYDQAAGVNTELIYAPSVFIALALLLQRKVYASAVLAAFAVLIKYTAVADILGAATVYCLLEVERDRVSKTMFKWGATLLGASSLCYGILYLYFRHSGVDLLDEIVFRNIKHASLSAQPIFASDSGLVVFLTVALIPSTCVLFASTLRIGNWRLFCGTSVWLLFSVAQGLLTKQYYYHYFVPAFVPLTLLLASLDLRERLMIPVLVAILGAGLSQINVNYHWRKEYDTTAAEYNSACAAILNGGYILTGFLAGYRTCGASSLDRFAFPPFYLKQHFAEVSGSGGMEGLRKKLQQREISSVVMTTAQFQKWGRTLATAGPIHVVPVSAWDD